MPRRKKKIAENARKIEPSEVRDEAELQAETGQSIESVVN